MATINSRAIAAKVLIQVLPLHKKATPQGRSLNDALPDMLAQYGSEDKALIQALCFGVCRQLTWLDQIANQLVRQPFKLKDRDLQALLLLGLYQLYFMRIPDHAAISETVEAARQLKKTWAVKVINGMLRRAQRDKTTLTQHISTSLAVTYSHPQWLVDLLKSAWPESYEKILAANNEPAPMAVRVNRLKTNRAAYLEQLNAGQIPAQASELSADGIRLTQPVDVGDLPGFSDGYCSVQDEAAQLAAQLLDPQPGDVVLDACAAPGGKTTHLLEKQAGIEKLVAVDNDRKRLDRVAANLERLQLTAELVCRDLLAFCDAQTTKPGFDRILLDVPCSATGVIRRHPDIKWLRKRKDISALADTQLSLLKACWSLLKPGGVLLYATCSVLPQENERVINQFLKQSASAREEIIILGEPGDQKLQRTPTSVGRQLLPEIGGSDGFYYAKLRKIEPGASQQ